MLRADELQIWSISQVPKKGAGVQRTADLDAMPAPAVAAGTAANRQNVMRQAKSFVFASILLIAVTGCNDVRGLWPNEIFIKAGSGNGHPLVVEVGGELNLAVYPSPLFVTWSLAPESTGIAVLESNGTIRARAPGPALVHASRWGSTSVALIGSYSPDQGAKAQEVSGLPKIQDSSFFFKAARSESDLAKIWSEQFSFLSTPSISLDYEKESLVLLVEHAYSEDYPPVITNATQEASGSSIQIVTPGRRCDTCVCFCDWRLTAWMFKVPKLSTSASISWAKLAQNRSKSVIHWEGTIE